MPIKPGRAASCQRAIHSGAERIKASEGLDVTLFTTPLPICEAAAARATRERWLNRSVFGLARYEVLRVYL
jgi:hypothetical protein